VTISKIARWGAFALAAVMSVGVADAKSPVKVGTLDCAVSNANKSLFKTHVVLLCEFKYADGSAKRTYQGTVDRAGLSLGNIEVDRLSWIVATLGKANNVKLDGTYIGAQAGHRSAPVLAPII